MSVFESGSARMIRLGYFQALSWRRASPSMSRSRILRLAVALAAASVMSIAAGGTGHTSAGAAEPGSVSGCEVPEREPLTADSTRDGIPQAAQWRASEEAQVALSDMAELINARFGDTSQDEWVQLRQGFIGFAPNDLDQTVYVVVDLQREEQTTLERELQEIAGDVLTVRVIQGCHRVSDLAAVGAQLSEGDPMRQTGMTYVADLDPNTSTFDVVVYAANGASLDAFADALIDRQLVRLARLEEPPTRDAGSRGHDAQPHWGGALINNDTAGGYCTSGFAIDTATAGKAFITAGHCGLVGDDFSSSEHSYGHGARRAVFPANDMLILNGAQNYDDDIYMNPIWPLSNPIDVGGKRTVGIGNHVCVSGAFSQAYCNLEVVGTGAVFCDVYPSQCTANLIRYNPQQGACQSGDSGAPVFSRWGSPEYARVVGMHIARGSKSDKPNAGLGCLAHKVGDIEATLDVTVATNP